MAVAATVAHRVRRGALAGAGAAAVWAAQQPLDKRLFACDYDDVQLLGKAITRSRGWYPLGLALHVANGACFGAVYASIAPHVRLAPWLRGLLAGMAEHVGLWPLTRLVDRHHPASGELPALSGNRRAFAQATWRHAIFGLALGAAVSDMPPARSSGS